MSDILATPEGGISRGGKRMIQWFTAADAQELDESGIMVMRPWSPEVADQIDMTALKAGFQARVLFRDESPDGLSLVHIWFGENYPLPRHTHSADCLYYVLRGYLRMGSKTIQAGDGLFIPAGRPYTYRAGPGGAEVLEFRASTAFDMTVLDQDVPRWQSYLQIAASMQGAWADTRPRPAQSEQGAGH